METVVSIGVAVLISFIVNWLLTLVIVVFVPIIIGAGLLQLLVLALHTAHYKTSTEEALKVLHMHLVTTKHNHVYNRTWLDITQIAVDSINNHKTVSALSVEEKFNSMFKDALDRSHK